MRLARAFDAAGDEREAAVPAARDRRSASTGSASAAPAHAAEALECLGGNGYVEESGMPRLYREAPLNSIWEGSGNVICLDVLRALAREPAGARGPPRRDRAGRRGADPPPRRPTWSGSRPSCRDFEGDRGRARGGRRAPGARPAGLAAGPLRRPGRRRRLLRRRASPATAAAPSARCRAASTSEAIIERHRRASSGVGLSAIPRRDAPARYLFMRVPDHAERQIDTPPARLRDPRSGWTRAGSSRSSCSSGS